MPEDLFCLKRAMRIWSPILPNDRATFKWWQSIKMDANKLAIVPLELGSAGDLIKPTTCSGNNGVAKEVNIYNQGIS